jgi:hypothetical protein
MQKATLDAMHPEGWTVASWLYPDKILDPDDRQLDESDNPNLFGGGHFVVNGAHVILSRRGRFIGYYAWGGRTYPRAGERKPWSAIISNPAETGNYGNNRTPRKTAGVLKSYRL